MILQYHHRSFLSCLTMALMLIIIAPLHCTTAESLMFEISYQHQSSESPSTSTFPFFPFTVEYLNGRRFLWAPPVSYPAEQGSPVLFLLHGASQFDVSWFFGLSRWSQAQAQFASQARNQGFFIIAPNSGRPIQPGPRAWDAFTPSINESEDLNFILDIIEWIDENQPSANSSCLFCLGFSSGAFMTSRIGHTLYDKFRGLIVHSGTNADMIELTNRGPVFDCTSPQNISQTHPPTLIIHGGKDRFVPVDCGIHFHEELLRNGIMSQLLFDPEGGHIWLSTFNEDILEWIGTFL